MAGNRHVGCRAGCRGTGCCCEVELSSAISDCGWLVDSGSWNQEMSTADVTILSSDFVCGGALGRSAAICTFVAGR